ncbi:hypothetical protein Desaci_0205 [Desulfosporosinus acidiphilus SJ4]|uniref:Uncharacterized protein n=1 Tax=Desulfosporosinus acidiphilus (strain DSM 22704 / JCM 16185 / SJ4) TaxID=646529 RepID=I4D0F5_DESAJ|nr:DUF523 domain-containing protein [Desulfosporosinus acidiphilus]AFM39279.1 hypothetical protein Desaci_0205 [Desulfosporosinus acidiphilus SJ4]
MYLISACLAGVNCRYDGKSTIVNELGELVKRGKAIAICPEVLGGLEIPRESCEIVKLDGEHAKVMSRNGNDLTAAFMSGAQKTLEIAKVIGINVAIMKSKSPSCGYGKIYDGTFSGTITDGNGFAAGLLASHGITIYTEEEFNASFDEITDS